MSTSFVRVSNCINREDETSVNSKLAITPSQMLNMTNQGRAISMTSLEGLAYYDQPNITDIPMEFVRGVDENILWEATEDTKEKFHRYAQYRHEQSLKDKGE